MVRCLGTDSGEEALTTPIGALVRELKRRRMWETFKLKMVELGNGVDAVAGGEGRS